MTETHHTAVAVLVAAAPIPALVAGVGGELHAAEGQGRAGVGMPVAGGADEGVDQRDRRLG